MAKYKVYYSGFAYVEADNEEEATEIYKDDFIYVENYVDVVEEVDEFLVSFD